MKVKTSKGFTLAELLIVMAIIVVLAAVAIPTFGKQLEIGRESADIQELRNAYTDTYAEAVYMSQTDSTLGSAASQDVSIAFRSTKSGFPYVPNSKVGGYDASSLNPVGKGKATFVYSVDSAGGVKLDNITLAS